jgi:hypothetical protein
MATLGMNHFPATPKAIAELGKKIFRSIVRQVSGIGLSAVDDWVC